MALKLGATRLEFARRSKFESRREVIRGPKRDRYGLELNWLKVSGSSQSMSCLKSSFRFESEVELFEVRNTGSELFEVLSSSISIKIESVFWNWSPAWNIRLFELWSFRIGEAWESWLKIAGRLKLKSLVKLFKPRERELLVKTSLKFLCWVDFCLKFTVGRDLLGERRFKIESSSLKFKDWSLKTRDWKACFKFCWEMQDCWIKLFWSFKVASKVQIRNFW